MQIFSPLCEEEPDFSFLFLGNLLNSNALLGQTCQNFFGFVSGLGMGEEEYSPELAYTQGLNNTAPGRALRSASSAQADGHSKSQEIICLCWSLRTIQCRGLVVSVTTLLNVIVSGFGEFKDAAGGRKGNSV